MGLNNPADNNGCCKQTDAQHVVVLTQCQCSVELDSFSFRIVFIIVVALCCVRAARSQVCATHQAQQRQSLYRQTHNKQHPHSNVQRRIGKHKPKLSEQKLFCSRKVLSKTMHIQPVRSRITNIAHYCAANLDSQSKYNDASCDSSVSIRDSRRSLFVCNTIDCADSSAIAWTSTGTRAVYSTCNIPSSS